MYVACRIIKEGTGKMLVEIVKDRKIPTLSAFIEKHLLIGSTIVTDVYSSYSSAVKKYFCNHKIVNPSIGFENIQGFHTNGIKNLWSQLKYYEKKD